MIDSIEALKILGSFRTNEIVVNTYTTTHEWRGLSNQPELDIPVMTMGKASSVGLGLALALPWRKVIVLDGDGGLLMNLGSLVTIANMAPPNFIHFVFENGVYRTTGGQPIPNSGKFNFAVLASTVGYANAHKFEQIDDFAKEITTILGETGPVLISLKVPAIAEPVQSAPRRTSTDSIKKFMLAAQKR